ncbi:hypothetical protein B0T17DRAFT_183296 [Bombardia bombarda]|uniref:Lipid droplet-associated hydrolase n=1 Tax=Bombardia bombarda TaxID=252184 RepID=A0AA39X9R4_9PEZI|nr:hypothetical protein B0T17DRAFT_183296 [Bombardia bombarda]
MCQPDDTDTVVHDISPNNDDLYLPKEQREWLIYIFPGNPGLISMYKPFAYALATLLRQSHAFDGISVRICGKSLIGFETTAGHQQPTRQGSPAGLRETILAVGADLLSHVNAVSSSSSVQVILIGHSIGAYILMEILRRRPQVIMGDQGGRINIAGGILLFPTITNIARSTAGMILTPILKLTYLASVVNTLVSVIFYLVPFICIAIPSDQPAHNLLHAVDGSLETR